MRAGQDAIDEALGATISAILREESRARIEVRRLDSGDAQITTWWPRGSQEYCEVITHDGSEDLLHWVKRVARVVSFRIRESRG